MDFLTKHLVKVYYVIIGFCIMIGIPMIIILMLLDKGDPPCKQSITPQPMEVPVKFITEPIKLEISLNVTTKMNNPDPITLDVNTNINNKPVNIDVKVNHDSKQIVVPIALSFEELKDKYGELIPKPKGE